MQAHARRVPRTSMAFLAASALAIATLGSSAPAAAAPTVPAPPVASAWFTPVVPARLLDTRPGESTIDGQGAPGAPIGPDATVTLDVLGRGGVPTSGVSAVVLNVTALNATQPSFVTVSPAGEARPETSNVNITSPAPVPNLVVAKLGVGGKVDIYNRAGSVDVIADVAGYFPAADEFVPLVPARLLETRPGLPTTDGEGRPGTSLGQQASLNVRVVGRGGVPSTGVDAVVLNVTAIAPSTESFVTVWPAGASRPVASNLNTARGVTRPNLVVAKVGAGGEVSVYNEAGNVDVAMDVAGYFPTGGTFVSVQPARLLETREGLPVAPGGMQTSGTTLGQDQTLDLPVLGVGGVPTTGVAAVVLNVTAIFPTSPSFVTVSPTGVARPTASNLNLAGRGEVVPNLVVARVGAGGKVSIYNAIGRTDMVVDVAGYFLEEPAALRTVSSANQATCVLDELGRTTCWGTASQDPTFVYPQLVTTPQELGVRPSPYPLRTYDDAIDVAVGGAHTCLLRSDRTVWCWSLGLGTSPTVGNGTDANAWPALRASGLTDVVAIDAEGVATCALRADGTVWCWGTIAGVVLATPTQIAGLTDAEQVSVGTNSVCAVRGSGTVACWGYNFSGVLGDGTGIDSPVTPVTVTGLADADSVVVMGLTACATRQNGEAVCWGNNYLGSGSSGSSPTPVPVTEDGTLLPVDDIVQIAGGIGYRCVLRSDQQVYCWGSSIEGQLGLTPSPTLSTTRVTTPVTGLPPVAELFGNLQHLCVVTVAGALYCWGDNAFGQLGDGTLLDRSTPTLIDWAAA